KLAPSWAGSCWTRSPPCRPSARPPTATRRRNTARPTAAEASAERLAQLGVLVQDQLLEVALELRHAFAQRRLRCGQHPHREQPGVARPADRKSTRLNSSHVKISYAVFCLKKKKSKQ